jgi:hypothetical protein
MVPRVFEWKARASAITIYKDALFPENLIAYSDQTIPDMLSLWGRRSSLAPDFGENCLRRWKREERLHRYAELASPVRPLLIGSRKVDSDRFHREIIDLDECQHGVRGCHVAMYGSGGHFAERRLWLRH